MRAYKMPVRDNRKKQLKSKKTKAKCPKCGEIYMSTVFWTGKGIARIYCEPCYKFVVYISRGSLSNYHHHERTQTHREDGAE